MGLDDLTGKAKDALNSEKGEQISDQGLDKAGEFAEGKGVGGDKVDKAKDAVDGKIGGGDEGEN
ncbi:Rv0909 family putative TA system antitoxin [Janibacter corallicola]|uniref:Rv0909 family putative TA system antitoxin n=1 Tax=Janibacter corallicola TaxID=415212 RepID=UPI000834FE85|nr:Rv0909 family putative TA system antitoxin [Janibacter corallicola]